MSDLIHALSGHSNGMEIAQVILAFAGIVFSLWALLDAVKDGVALKLSGANGARSIIANGNIWTEAERLVIHLILFFVGFASVLLPPPYAIALPVPQPELLQHTLTRIGLMIITIIKVEGALRARHERRLFVRRMSSSGFARIPMVRLSPPPGSGTKDIYEVDDPRVQRRVESIADKNVKRKED